MNQVISMLGIEKDHRGFNERRWQHWRPNITLCSQPDFPVAHLILLVTPGYDALLALTLEDIAQVSPQTKVTVYPFSPGGDAWDYAEAYETMRTFADTLDQSEDYFVHISTGTHATQFALASLVMSQDIPGKVIQTSACHEQEDRILRARGRIKIIDFQLAKYDALTARLLSAGTRADVILKQGITTQSVRYNDMITKIEKVAVRSNAPLLLLGETGAGKTQLARQIYALKKANAQVKGDFISVNCATLNGNSEGAKSALFGHVKGAYTGAVTAREGLLQRAHHGVLFLDEIGTLGMEEQGLLLYALESGEYFPLGSEKPARASFSLMCGTNQDLRAAVEQGTFRRDLLARIKQWCFTLPSLRERREDIEPNIEFELIKQGQEQGRKCRFNREAYRHYLDFALSEASVWRDNFRDLSGSIARLCTLSDNGRITLELVEDEIARLKEDWDVPAEERARPAVESVRARVLSAGDWQALSHYEQAQISAVLSACITHPTQSQAAHALYAVAGEALVQNPSGRLSNFLQKYGLSFKSIREAI